MSPLVAKAAAILREEGVTEIYVFGSYARGDARPDSDLDLAVAGLPAAHHFRVAGRLAGELGVLVDLLDIEEAPAFFNFLQSRGELRRVA
jgi:predicted nucleotidyltransferase